MFYSKNDFIKRMAKKGYTQKDCYQIVDDLFGTIEDILLEGNGVKFKGFGAFEIKTRSARNGTNPYTREPMVVPETKNVRFTVGTKLEKSVKEALEG